MTTEIHPTQTKLVPLTPGMRERDFYIDCLRSVMIALVVLLHACCFAGGPRPRWSNSPSPAPSRALPVGYWPIRLSGRLACGGLSSV